jgi:hypothetical protein
MHPELGQAELDRRIAAASIEERAEWLAAAREAGLRSVWQQADAAGLSDPVEQADFILRRLYPEMPAAWFDDIVGQLRALHAAGRWSGFRRP